MLKNLWICLFLIVVASGCTQRRSAKPDTYGVKPSLQEVTSLRDVFTNPDQYQDKTILVEGLVRNVCRKKGCWMEVSESSDALSRSFRVTFKDYGFFVPTTSAGSRVRIQGTVQQSSLSPEDVTHLEAEGAKFSTKMPDGSVASFSLVASGVELQTKKSKS